VARKARLTDSQDRRMRRIAREKGLACPDCGSSEPVPKEEGEIRDRPNGGLEVPMRCEACEGNSEMAVVLSPKRPKRSACTRWEDTRKRHDVLRNALLIAWTSEDAIQVRFAEESFRAQA
jgi:hypothetical protein